MDRIVVIGASGHAKVITDIIEENGQNEIFGFIDSFKKIGTKILGYEVIGDERQIPYLIKKEGITKGIIAIGDNWLRKEMFKKIKAISHNFEYVSAIHPSAIISNYSTIGRGVAIMAGAVINAEARVEDFSIVNTKASLGHESILKKYGSLSSGVIVGGSVHIGPFTAISIGATIINNISIGKHSVIGAGAVVTKNIGNFQVVYGIPAKFVHNRKKGENYLRSNVISP